MNQDSTYQLLIHKRVIKNKKTSFVPIEDGFITSAGNPKLAAKYGNILDANNIPTQNVTLNNNLRHDINVISKDVGHPWSSYSYK